MDINKIYEFLSEFIHTNLVENLKIGLAVSGGVDSMVLLNILNSYKKNHLEHIDLTVCHMNHCLRGLDSDKDEELVKETCNRLEINFISSRVDIKKKSVENKASIEATARLVRFNFYSQISYLKNINSFLLAHNSNDQAETILMNIMRGSGVNGLLGMSRKKLFSIKAHENFYPLNFYKFDNKDNHDFQKADLSVSLIPKQKICILRPLLNSSKDEIIKHAESNSIKWREDKSNKETEFLRNKVRNDILPNLSSVFKKNVASSLLRLQKNISQENDFIEKYSNEILEKIREKHDAEDFSYIKLELFYDLHSAIKSKIIFLWLKENNISEISEKIISKIIDIANSKSTPSKVNLAKNLQIKRKSSILSIQKIL